jgi:hypothetical protein
MSDWHVQQLIKASGWPLDPAGLAAGTDFNAPQAGGLVPLTWACEHGKAGLLRHLLVLGANPLDHPLGAQGLLALVVRSADYQAVMLLIDHLKAAGVPAPDEALKKQLVHTFRASHTNARNRVQQTLKDWDRLTKINAPAKGDRRPAQ